MNDRSLDMSCTDEADGRPAATQPLLDACGRRLEYLRVSLTDRCNFRCVYCMPAEGVPKLRHEEMLRLEELAELVRLFVERLGMHKVRVTGGEPLIRRGVLGFMRDLGAITGLRDLSMTTNAFHLADKAAGLRAAGVARLNISLDTLRRERFRQLTRHDGLEQVLLGIAAACGQGFQEIKLNVVSMRETLDEARDLIRFGIENDLQVRFIELMPSHGGPGVSFIPNSRIRHAIEAEYPLTPIPEADEFAGRTAAARLYRIGDTGKICGFISPITQPFCERCNRLRLRGDGQLLPCLSRSESYDLMPFIRPAWRPGELAAHLRELLPRCKGEAPPHRAIRAMSRIGG
jgi:cyclic pyranopterin phosphate synthase